MTPRLYINRQYVTYLGVVAILVSFLFPAITFSKDMDALQGILKEQSRLSVADLKKAALQKALHFEKLADKKVAEHNLQGAIIDYGQALLMLPKRAVTKEQKIFLKRARAILIAEGRDSLSLTMVSNHLKSERGSYAQMILFAMLGQYHNSLELLNRKGRIGLSNQSKEKLLTDFGKIITGKDYSELEKTFLFLRTMAEAIGGVEHYYEYYAQMLKPDHDQLKKKFPVMFERYISTGTMLATEDAKLEPLVDDYIDRFPAQSFGYFTKAYVLLEQKQGQEAVANLHRATQISPYDVDNDIVSMLDDIAKLGFVEDVLVIAKRLGATSPNNERLFEFQFGAYVILEKYNEAIQVFSEVKQNDLELSFAVALLRLQIKDWTGAQQELITLWQRNESHRKLTALYLLAGQKAGRFHLGSESKQDVDKHFNDWLKDSNRDKIAEIQAKIVEEFQAEMFIPVD